MRSPRFRRFVRIGIAALAVMVVGGPLIFIYSGVYDVAATRQHTVPVYWAFVTILRRSIRAHATSEVPAPPDLSDSTLVENGLLLYDRNCTACHGAPGIAPAPLALGLNPPPPNLVPRGRDRSPQEIYWTITNGLKMTGMPAWQYRLTDRERWAVVAFVRTLPTLSPSVYRAQRLRLTAATSERESQP